ncbi:hypothetical protein Baya_1231 [Bagarius yarrelli]|uniref:Immunoglobulin V-set domain-containing protein n=1 Tax=Bagarius yarrelli TaxID=175774 RepID=A0A556TKI1_BAGYA|nr:hypothetical protein Baya_1231 [Bagarius yarrelli]
MKTSSLCVTLLPIFLFSCALPEKQCQWKYNIPEIQRVAVYSNVSVPCPRFSAVEMSFRLYKGQNEVAFITYKNVSHIINLDNLENRMNHYVNTSTNFTHFVLYNVTMDATALYTCTAKKSYPPPLENIREEPQTIVIVESV